MDVETQMEAKGYVASASPHHHPTFSDLTVTRLPVQFNSTSDQPQGSHVTDNLTASISNSEANVNLSPSGEPVTQSSLLPEPAPAVTEAVAEKVPESLPEAVSVEAPEPSTNDSVVRPSEAAQTSSTSVPLSVVPDSQPESTHDEIAATTSFAESKTTETLVPSSIPAEAQSSATSVEVGRSVMDISEPSAVPAQAPTSDLRTSPHADALTPDAVATVEARKHELDNSADAVETPTASKPDIMDTSFPTVGQTVEATSQGDQPPVTNIGLPSPPAQSPPSAPQAAPATSPESKPTEHVVEPPRETATAPASVPAPAEQPKEPAPTPAVPSSTEPQDQVMEDVPSQPVKQVHGREEARDDVEPAAKRVRTEEPQSSQQAEFKIPDVPTLSSSDPAPAPASALTNGTTATAVSSNGVTDGDDTVTAARLAHMKKVISNLKKSNASAAFRLPVDPVALNIPNYPEIVKHPMDLGTIDQRLKRNEYTSISAFIADFEQIVYNCVLFNGDQHAVTQAARKMQTSFHSQMRNLPKATIEEPPKEIKKATKKHEPTRSAPPRRPSVTTSTGVVSSHNTPKSAAPPTPSFAPGPDGIPLIRRDSTLADGRPKRAIVPTKRNQEFGGGRPKKKKYELQLKFCDEVLKELVNPKHWQINQYFTHPVDPVALNIPTYFQIIKKPMDLGTIRTKLNNNVYEKAKDFEEDVRLVFKNCYKFNPEGDLVNSAGHQLEDLFNKKWATKDEWIAAREPPSEPQSDAEAEDDEDDDSEEDVDDSEEERNDKIKLLQKQIEEMSKQMGELTQKKHKKSKSPPTKKSKSKPSKKDKPAASFPNLGKDKKEKKKSAPRARPEKDRYVTFAEKQYISNGIAMLPEKQMQEALKIIQNSVPSLTNSDQNEIELDIEEVPNHALLKLLNFVKKYAGPPPDEPKVEQSEVYAAAPKSKKSKPMSKHEQEAQIEELKGKLGAYHGAVSPNAVPSIEAGDSSDDGDSEESEEE